MSPPRATPAAFLLRPLTLADAEATAALVRRAFAAQPLLTDPPPSALRETGAAIAAILAAGGGGAAAEAGTALAGAVIWEEKAGGLYMGRLSVDPGFRGTGLARALIAAAEAEARRRGLPRLWLSTRLALAANRRLFASCGFTETARHAHPGYCTPTFVDMEKALPSCPTPLPAPC
jgi:ribosomal protein S18 acetylase RimI-like enzyme